MDIPGHDDNRVDDSHAEVVLVLPGKLLAAQLIQLNHLLRQSLTGLEALSSQVHLQQKRQRETVL